MKRYAPFVLGFLVLGWLWLAARDARQREAGRAEVLAAQLDSAAAYHDSVAVVRALRDSAQRQEIRALQVQYRTALGRYSSATKVADSLTGTLAAHLAADTSETAGLVRETVAALTGEIAACGLVAASCEAIQVRQDSVIQRQDSSLRDLRGLYDATHQALQVERKRAAPGFFRRLEMALPLMGATAVIVLVVAR